ncbi:hypothetical protein DV515_00017549, partial [Chloebia gouldiae]
PQAPRALNKAPHKTTPVVLGSLLTGSSFLATAAGLQRWLGRISRGVIGLRPTPAPDGQLWKGWATDVLVGSLGADRKTKRKLRRFGSCPSRRR